MRGPGPARAALACLLALLPCRAAGAQSPHDRAALDRLRDSLAATHDSSALARSYRATRHAPAGAAALRELRLGLVALRLAELDRGSLAGTALGHLRRAARRAPDWP